MKYKNQFVMKDSKKLAQPFFKWVGGKRQIADIILDEFPSEIENYYEPFVGAGAILFRVLQEYPNLKHVHINDSNNDVVWAYAHVRDNIDTAREIVKYAKKMHIPKIVYFSTKIVYGQASNPIISEDADIINPDMYGLTKRVAESIFSEDKDIQTIGLRTPGIIGDGAHDIWLKSIAEKIIRNEDVSVSDFETRNLVDIDDIAQFIYQLITDKRFDEGYPYSVINLACEKKIHNRDIAEIIKKVSGSSSTITTHKAEDGLFVLDENKAREMGFRSSDPQKIVKRYIEGLIK